MILMTARDWTGRAVVMKDQIEVKQASVEDAETILQLQMRSYLSEAEIYNDYGIPHLIQSLNEIKQEFSQQAFLKAIEKERDDEKEEGEEGDDSNKIENIVGSCPRLP